MKSSGEYMFVVLYRWRIHEEYEEEFVKAWSRNSDIYLKELGSLGSRLHRGSDGFWYSYAQWPSEQARKEAFANGTADADASARMEIAIAERFPPVILNVQADFLQYPSADV
jgi:heme-degrading monooxygenase HmoA